MHKIKSAREWERERVWEWSLSLRVRCAAAGAAICDADSAVFFWVTLRLQPVLQAAQLYAHVCVWRRHLTAKCREMRCVAALRCSAAGPPIDPSFYYRECASVQVCTRTHTHTCITFICMYVCKWEKSTMGVGSCHFACPCMSVHAYNTIFHVVFLCTIFTHFPYFSCSAKERDGDRRCKNILLPFFLAHNLLKKTLNLICCFCCCCKWVLKYTHKMLPIYTMHTHTYRAYVIVCVSVGL